MARILLGAVICSLFIAVNCMYSASDDVVTLTPSNFNREVIESDGLWLVEFYAPWCGHCRSLTPEWKKAATALKGIVNVGAVDADQHKSLGGQYEVRGYPTIKIFGANKNRPEDYQGGRTSEAIVDSAINALRSLAKARLSGRGGGYDSGKQRVPKQQSQDGRNQKAPQQCQRQQQQQRRRPPQQQQQHRPSQCNKQPQRQPQQCQRQGQYAPNPQFQAAQQQPLL